MNPLRIAYFGSGNFAVAPLDALLNCTEDCRVIAIVCQPDRPVGRKRLMEACPVGKVAATKAGISVFKPERVRGDSEFEESLRSLDLDLAVVASYGQILPEEILKIPRLGFLNLHGSILPAWRGASPIQSAILAGEKTTGVSLMVMDEKMDHGPILKTAELEIAPHDTYASLENRLSHLAADLAINWIRKFTDGEMLPIEQDHDNATFCRTLKRENGHIMWNDEDAAMVERKLRAFTPWPGIYTVWERNGKPIRIKIFRVRIETDTKELSPGTVMKSEDGYPTAIAADGNQVVILECQMEGKPTCSGQDMVRGYPDIVGSRLQ